MSNSLRQALFSLIAGAGAAAWLTAAGCGGGAQPSSASPEIPPAGGISEQFLVEHPSHALNATHTVLLNLEASGGGVRDTGAADGVDEVPFFFERSTDLTLRVTDELAEAPTLVLLDDVGIEVARLGPDHRQQTVTVSGAHTLEVRHPRAGAAEVEAQLVFLRPVGTGPGNAAGPAGANDLAAIEAGKDCVACDLRGIAFQGPAVVQNIRLTLADFTGATISSGVVFLGTDLIGTVFDQVRFQSMGFGKAILTRASFKGATFVRAPDTCEGPLCRTSPDDPNCCFVNCSISFELEEAPGALNQVDFSGATFGATCLRAPDLSGTIFTGATFDDASTVAPSNFAGSDLRGVRFLGSDVRGFDPVGESRYAAASFAGALLSDDVSGVSFSGVDLANVDFRGTDLRRASFAGSTLNAATNFAGANFSGSDFAGVDLTRANLSTAILSASTSFVGATLSDTTAHGANLACLKDQGTGACEFAPQTTQFRGMNLSFVNLSGASLEGADLGATVFSNARLVGANLNFANLKDATLRGALLGVEPGSGATVTQLGGAYMVNVDLTDADLRGADLSGAHLYGTSLLVRTRLDAADFSDALCAGATFSGSLTDTVFNHAVLVNATFNGANLTDAKFDSAYLQGTDFSAATSVAGATLRNAATSTAPGAWMFMEQDGTPFTLEFGATNLGAFAVDRSVICPNNQNGPCTMETLTPVENGPFPPQPPCVPSEQFCFENCLSPPVFSNTPPCQ